MVTQGNPIPAINLRKDDLRSNYFHRKWSDGHASVKIQKGFKPLSYTFRNACIPVIISLWRHEGNCDILITDSCWVTPKMYTQAWHKSEKFSGPTYTINPRLIAWGVTRKGRSLIWLVCEVIILYEYHYIMMYNYNYINISISISLTLNILLW